MTLSITTISIMAFRISINNPSQGDEGLRFEPRFHAMRGNIKPERIN
jgi:hypothetical protein